VQQWNQVGKFLWGQTKVYFNALPTFAVCRRKPYKIR